jgi:hypothetical protein
MIAVPETPPTFLSMFTASLNSRSQLLNAKEKQRWCTAAEAMKTALAECITQSAAQI